MEGVMMARRPRLNGEGALHHVIIRGIEKKGILRMIEIRKNL